MRPVNAYKQQPAAGLPRVDVIVTVYDVLLSRLERCRAELASNPEEARKRLAQCRIALLTLALGIDPQQADVAANFQRLYEFAAYCVELGTDAALAAAITILRDLRAGFELVRTQAVELERAGVIPTLDRAQAVEAVV